MTVENYLAEAGALAGFLRPAVALLILFAAIYVFVGGIGIAGRVRSRTAGILTTLLAIVST